VIRNRRSSGFLVADALGAIFLIGIATSLFATAIFNHRKVESRLVRREAAIRLADRELVRMRIGLAKSDIPSWAQITTAPLADQKSAPVEWQWVRIQVAWDREAVSMIGLIPKGAP
jgi:hypothetical protein